jgi:deoxycytidine triphosphate deaminase
MERRGEFMVIGLDKIRSLMDEGRLIHNVSERDLLTPEGAGLDLRVGEINEISGSGFLGRETRNTPNLTVVASVGIDPDSRVNLQYSRYYLFTTMEEIDLPSNVVAFVQPRSTLFRSGVVLSAGVVSPGYRGKLTFGATVMNPNGFDIEIGSRVAHINFHYVDGSTEQYRGQWQGGRIGTASEERQT